LFHDLPAPTECRKWQATPDHFAEGPEVGPHTEAIRHAPPPEAEPGDHLVEDEERTRRVTRRSKAGEPSSTRGDEPHVGGNRLDNDTGDGFVECGHDIVGRHDRRGNGAGRYAGGAGEPERRNSAPAAGEQPVGVTVIAPRELHDLVAASRATRHPHRRHRCFRARRHEPDEIEAFDGFDEHLGQLHLGLGRSAEGRPPGGRAGDRLEHVVIGVTED
jgi:hypothetical protein